MKTQVTKQVDRSGLFMGVPRFLRTGVIARLMELEENQAAFDRVALMHRAKLKKLYAVLHVRPGPQAQALLFGKPPEHSALGALRKLGQRPKTNTAAGLVREHRIPMLIAESALGTITEPVALALVETMSDDELLSRLPLLARRALVRGRVRQALVQRLGEMRQTVPYPKAESVIRQAKLEGSLARAIMRLVPTGGDGSLDGNTAVLIDGSLSMGGGFIALGVQTVLSLDRSLVPSAKLQVVVFGSGARVVSSERGLRGDALQTAISKAADGFERGTSVGAGVELVRTEVKRFVIVSDGYENRPPRIATALRRHRDTVGPFSELALVQPPSSGRQLAVDLKNASIPFKVFQAGHQTSGLEALVGVLSGPAQDPVAEICAYPLD